MTTPSRSFAAPRLRRFAPLKLAALAGAALSLSGCLFSLPPAVQMASLALDGFSYAATGKSVTDHALSAATRQDCAMLRPLQGDEICFTDADPKTALAALDAGPGIQAVDGKAPPPAWAGPWERPNPLPTQNMDLEQLLAYGQTVELENLAVRETQRADQTTAQPQNEQVAARDDGPRHDGPRHGANRKNPAREDAPYDFITAAGPRK